MVLALSDCGSPEQFLLTSQWDVWNLIIQTVQHKYYLACKHMFLNFTLKRVDPT